MNLVRGYRSDFRGGAWPSWAFMSAVVFALAIAVIVGEGVSAAASRTGQQQAQLDAQLIRQISRNGISLRQAELVALDLEPGQRAELHNCSSVDDIPKSARAGNAVPPSSITSNLFGRGLFTCPLFSRRRRSEAVIDRPVLKKEDYIIQLVNRLGKYASFAYNDKEQMEANESEHAKFIVKNMNVIRSANRKVQAMIVQTHDAGGHLLFITFRGMTSWNNMLETAKFSLSPVSFPMELPLGRQLAHVAQLLSGVRVHRGFLNLYMSVRGELLGEVRKRLDALGSETVVSFVGHSMGGALAQLAALDFVTTPEFRNAAAAGGALRAVPQVGTFGAPRVGNSAFAAVLNALVPHMWRAVNENDVISHLPPKAFGYHHAAGEVYSHNGVAYACDRLATRIGGAAKYRARGVDPNKEDKACSDARVPLLQFAPAHYLFLRHAVATLHLVKNSGRKQSQVASPG